MDHYYHSSLIPTQQNVSWMVHNISEVHSQGAWTALSCGLELPFGSSRISKWSVSLFENNGVVYVRPRMVSPQNESVTYQISVRIGGELIAFKVSETSNKPKDQPKFEIGNVQSILSKASEDRLELGIVLTLFNQDHWETKE